MAEGLEQSPFFVKAVKDGDIVVADAPKFSLESYINEYSGKTRLYRLAHISWRSTYLCLDAISAAITESKRVGDVHFYLSAMELLQKLELPSAMIAKLPKDIQSGIDVAWVEKQTRTIKAETDRLEAELRTYKNNLIKESIRMGNEELGKHYYNIGDLPNAAKAYGRMRDYCTTQKHIADMTLRLIFVSIAQRNWNSVQSWCTKLHTVTLRPEERERIDPIEMVCQGLSSLSTGNYGHAAEEFLRVNPSYVNGEPQAGIVFQKQVMTGNDVAVYGGLCALASMDRKELQSRVLNNSNFRQFLELEPHIRRAITAFVGSKYTTCLQILDSYRVDYVLDIHLYRHFDVIYDRVRSKSIVQYFIPFSVVTFTEMEKAFPPRGGKGIQDELVGMIQSGLLDARIDIPKKLLVAPKKNPRAEVQASAVNMSKAYERNLRLRLVRMNMLNAGLQVQAPKSAKQGGYDIAGLVDDNYSSAPSARVVGGGRKAKWDGSR
ncbi:hypothetical protein NA57DRAFT_79466 [Rhizodiscina lignyota]|uniref:PCI domain-containing protein n=1 Tax=Rhizodiscina lignyota TaxID=1504668 RepID=A0A9P4M5X5_9PEZI|nr:hypothetical protein NA57DRAFT_79466 [Rhizodiscina lignyota]